ncbi:hypothetical protein HDU76_008572, partial [Blyttiomyces sp. JEL0837]
FTLSLSISAVKSHYNNLKSKYNAIIAAENVTGNKKKPPKKPLCWKALVEHFGDKSGVGVQSFRASHEGEDQEAVAVDDDDLMEVDDSAVSGSSTSSVANEAREETPASEISTTTASTATTSGTKTPASTVASSSKTPAVRSLLKKDSKRGRSDGGNITDAGDKIGKGLEMLGDKVFMASGGRKQADTTVDQTEALDHLAKEIKVLASQQEEAAKRQEQIAQEASEEAKVLAKEGLALQAALLEAIRDLKK